CSATIIGYIEQEPGSGSANDPTQIAPGKEQREVRFLCLLLYLFPFLSRFNSLRAIRYMIGCLRCRLYIPMHYKSKTRSLCNPAAQVERSQGRNRAESKHKSPCKV